MIKHYSSCAKVQGTQTTSSSIKYCIDLRGEAEDEAERVRADADERHDVLMLQRQQDAQLLAHVEVGLARVLQRVLAPASLLLLVTTQQNT